MNDATVVSSLVVAFCLGAAIGIRRGTRWGVAVTVALVVLFGIVDQASAHTPLQVRASMPDARLVHRLEVNLRHSHGAVRFLERRAAVRRSLSARARGELAWHRRAERRQQRALGWVAARLSWLDAVALVDRHLGSGAWLRSCSAPQSEGGWGRWIWNGGGAGDDVTRGRLLAAATSPTWPQPARPAGSSGAGGWLQFLDSTFASVIDGAVVRARAHGLVVPRIARSWLSPLGQAVAGVEMLARGRRGEWSGYGC